MSSGKKQVRIEDHIGLVTPPEVAAVMARADETFGQIPNWLLASDIGHAAFRVYCAIVSFADNVTRFAYPTKQELAVRARMSVSHVERALTELKRLGAVWMFERWRGIRRGIESWTTRRDDEHPMQDSNGYVALWNTADPVENLSPDPVDNPEPDPADEEPSHPIDEDRGHPAGGVQNYIHSPRPNNQRAAAPAAPVDKPRRNLRLPEDWQPGPELIVWARTWHPSVNAQWETEKFVHHHLSIGDVRRDWTRAWKGWICKATEFAARRHAPRSRPQLTSRNAGPVLGELITTRPDVTADLVRELYDVQIDITAWFDRHGNPTDHTVRWARTQYRGAA